MASLKNEEPYHYDKQTLLSEHCLFPIKIRNTARKTSELTFVKILELNNLNKNCIKICDLLPNDENQNSFIYATQISTLVKGETIRFIVEDEFDNVCRVSIPGNTDTTHLVEGGKLAFHNPIYELAFDEKYSLIISDISDINLFRIPPKSSSEHLRIDHTCLAYLPNCNEIDFCDESESTIKLLTSQPTSLVDNSDGIDPSLTQEQTSEDSTLEIIDSELVPKQSETANKQSKHENPFQSCVDIPQVPEVVLAPSGDGLNLSEIGNKFFKEGRYLQAIIQYTCAIQVNDRNAKFYSNRAMCFNKFEEFENALSDFQKANLLEPDCVKYQYLIALTWSRIGNHKLSLNLLRMIKPIDTIDFHSIFNLIEKEEVYMKHISGDFDFVKIMQNLSVLTNSIDIADYIGPIQILNSPNKGRGIFTTRNVKKGENLCVVKANEIMTYTILNCTCSKCRFSKFNSIIQNTSLRDKLMEKARKSKLTTVRIISLCDRSITNVNIDLYSGCGYEFAKNFDTTPYPMEKLPSLAVNIRPQMDPTILRNQLVTPDTFAQNPFGYTDVGFWFLPSFINHSCIPNAVKIHIRDICIVRTITDIPEGDEVLASLYPLSLCSHVDLRQCDCKLCHFERIPAVEAINSQIASQLNALSAFQYPLSSRCVLKPREEFEKITVEMWFKIRSNLFKLVKKLKSLQTYEVFSIYFQEAIITLVQISLKDSDALELLLEAEPYFSHFNPEHYLIFWALFDSRLRGNEKLRDHRFQHVEKKYNDLIKLFT
ncbi:hypothetical protein LOD99_13400 [Oopsacas minuta]|uniref:SET domain-containing protein n=1 Tax=Oopsacas minuta TaxID=111878 RepID=A0AAV7KJC2_9METZ|nr:hypothetical protein LOD99_13400 [Oopsacas minuta]